MQRKELTRNKGSGLWKRQFAHLFHCRSSRGFKAHPDLFIRTGFMKQHQKEGGCKKNHELRASSVPMQVKSTDVVRRANLAEMK
jgi:hypothetical protein